MDDHSSSISYVFFALNYLLSRDRSLANSYASCCAFETVGLTLFSGWLRKSFSIFSKPRFASSSHSTFLLNLCPSFGKGLRAMTIRAKAKH